jgi:hypothetical protein
MTTRNIAEMSGVSVSLILMHRSNHKEEFIYGKHYIYVSDIVEELFDYDNDCNLPMNTPLYTRMGINCLLLRIRRISAKRFRESIMNMDENNIK